MSKWEEPNGATGIDVFLRLTFERSILSPNASHMLSKMQTMQSNLEKIPDELCLVKLKDIEDQNVYRVSSLMPVHSKS